MTIKAIQLIRVSTEGQAGEDRASIPAQRTINERTARAYGLTIIETIELVDVSGAAVLRAPGMQRLLKRIEDPDIHGVVVREFSRLLRPNDFADYILLQKFADTKTVLYLPDGPVDFASKMGRLLGSIRAAIAGLERTEILERVWSAKEEKRRAGKFPQAAICLPFGVGYDAKNERWFYKPEVEKVREAARRFLAGETSYKDVGRAVGIDAFNLRIILRNPIYTGWRIYDKRRDPSSSAIRTREDGRQGDRPKIARAPEDVIRIRVLDPIISERDFARLQQVMDLKKQNHWRARGDERRFTFGGFLRCGECGNLIYTHASHGRDWYSCKGRRLPTKCANPYMRRERLERVLDALIANRLMNRAFLRQVTEAYASRASNGDKPELARVESGLEALKEKKQRILESYFEGLIDRAERDERLAGLESESALYGKLAARAESAVPMLTAKQLAAVLSVFREWEFLGLADKRKLLRAAMPEIHVSGYRVTGLSLIPESSYRDDVNRSGTDSSPPPT